MWTAEMVQEVLINDFILAVLGGDANVNEYEEWGLTEQEVNELKSTGLFHDMN